MRRDVHLEALRIAAKVVLSIGLLDGCTPARARDATANEPEPAPTDAPTPASEPDELATTPAPEPVYADTTPTVASDCRAVVAAAFPVPNDYPGKTRDVGAGVQTCCAQLIMQPQGLDQYQWDCCANLPDDVDDRVRRACTPWGPPVPPAMPKRTIARLA